MRDLPLIVPKPHLRFPDSTEALTGQITFLPSLELRQGSDGTDPRQIARLAEVMDLISQRAHPLAAGYHRRNRRICRIGVLLETVDEPGSAPADVDLIGHR